VVLGAADRGFVGGIAIGVGNVNDGEISPELLDRWALSYLGRYASSAENLRRVLRRRANRRQPPGAAHAAALIDALVARYLRSGLLDDSAYAAGRVRSLHRRGESAVKIRARLAAAGIASAVATEALMGLRAEAFEPDLAAACAFARRRRLGPYRRAAADPARELAAFARAGFARAVAERVLACADTDAVEVLARAEHE
jgi:regulatory protein